MLSMDLASQIVQDFWEMCGAIIIFAFAAQLAIYNERDILRSCSEQYQ